MFEIATNLIFSHSNPSAAQVHPRNISDDLIRARAAIGGVVGINGIRSFLGRNDNTSETFARHVDHVAQLVGPQHVALGLDCVFDSQELDDYLVKMASTFPPELGDQPGMRMVAPEQLEISFDSLQRIGQGDADLRAVLGGHLMRLARSVWKPAGWSRSRFSASPGRPARPPARCAGCAAPRSGSAPAPPGH